VMHNNAETNNHFTELIQCFKMILLKKFCMCTKVAMFQHISHEYLYVAYPACDDSLQ